MNEVSYYKYQNIVRIIQVLTETSDKKFNITSEFNSKFVFFKKFIKMRTKFTFHDLTTS